MDNCYPIGHHCINCGSFSKETIICPECLRECCSECFDKEQNVCNFCFWLKDNYYDEF